MAKEPFNWLVNKIHDENLQIYGKKYLSGKLIDIGCGIKPYSVFFKDTVDNHIGVDIAGCIHGENNIDLIGTAYSIPTEDETFDSALCTAVLEHLEEPDIAIKECHRILKKGGYAIYSVPFIWHLHEEPRDFFRYSKYGLSYLFEKNNFTIIELISLSGFWVTFGQLFCYYIQDFNKSFIKKLRLIDIFTSVIQRLSYFLDKVHRKDSWTWMYMIVVRKNE